MAYTEAYESDLLRGDQEPPPWRLREEIAALARGTDRMLDIGCGTMFKTLALAPLVGQVVGVEPNPRMLAQARANILAGAADNAFVVAGHAEQLPFPDASFDLVTVMLAPHDTGEISRVLRPGGRAVLEKIGDRDKSNFKTEFGADEHGPRGQFADLAAGERARAYETEFAEAFTRTEVRQGFWATYYTRPGLELVLEQTSAVRNYDPVVDKPVVDRICQEWTTDRGIRTTQNRILIHAWK
ncbi:class I SAM-dependent methyltransferase [Crossiella sp. CA-258035]|uniref:class I SAM-dependent methyltransferase n=1 Tax=Crossiella sp. CA-258035 TaxID=2981138 RepID=UPI0024BC3411|nr:class I SAM-dependent methyltransferase [Crossiella sp. CA-258035]WHT20667.1 class I SAM-dependent methyltransferase [Crossiella sp. CA-258035]